jgi:hypothetical protein
MKLILKIAAAIIVVVVATVGVFGALTFPTEALSFSVTFTIGADIKSEKLNIPVLHDKVMVEVNVNSGSALWTARILSQAETLWGHSAVQGGQTTYNSGWISLSSGTYNFTFATAGAGSLSAHITVSSKGGFW